MKSVARLRWVLSFVVLAGCASSIYGWQVRTNSTTTSASFLPANLEGQTIALLGAVTSSMLQGTEVALSQVLAQIIQQIAPSLKVLSPQEVTLRINRNGLVGDYIRMRGDYWQSDILDGNSLRTIASAIGVRYVFQPRLATFLQMMTPRFEVPAANVWLIWVRSSIMRASLQLWDAETGEMVWHSYAESTVQNEAFSQDPVYFEEIARVTFASMISDFLNGKTASTYTQMDKLIDKVMQKKVDQPEKAPNE